MTFAIDVARAFGLPWTSEKDEVFYNACVSVYAFNEIEMRWDGVEEKTRVLKDDREQRLISAKGNWRTLCPEYYRAIGYMATVEELLCSFAGYEHFQLNYDEEMATSDIAWLCKSELDLGISEGRGCMNSPMEYIIAYAREARGNPRGALLMQIPVMWNGIIDPESGSALRMSKTVTSSRELSELMRANQLEESMFTVYENDISEQNSLLKPTWREEEVIDTRGLSIEEEIELFIRAAGVQGGDGEAKDDDESGGSNVGSVGGNSVPRGYHRNDDGSLSSNPSDRGQSDYEGDNLDPHWDM